MPDPQVHPVSAACLRFERLAAPTRRLGVRVLDGEPATRQVIDEIDLGAREVTNADGVDEERHTVRLKDPVGLAVTGLRIGAKVPRPYGAWNLESMDSLGAWIAAAPDLVVLADDYVIDSVLGGTFVAPEELAPILGELRAPLGVYAVLGNHDW